MPPTTIDDLPVLPLTSPPAPVEETQPSLGILADPTAAGTTPASDPGGSRGSLSDEGADAGAAVSTAPSHAAWTASETLAGAWLAALLVAGALLTLGGLALAWVLLRSRPAPNWVHAECATLADRIGMDAAVRIRIRASGGSPFCCPGSTVMLPASLLEDREALRAVLAHELAHLAARDPLRKALGGIVGSVLLLHPAYWLLRRAHHAATEELADARATTALGGRASRYARPLIELCARMGRPDPLAIAPPGAVGALGGRSAFTRRMKMLLTLDPNQTAPRCSRRQRRGTAVVMTALLALTSAAWGTPTTPQDPTKGAAATPQDTLEKRLDRKVSPDFRRCSLEEALKFVAHALEDPIVIDQEVLDAAIEIESLRLPEMTVRRLLDTLAAIHGLEWTTDSDSIVFRFEAGKGTVSRAIGGARSTETPSELSARDKEITAAALELMRNKKFGEALSLLSEEQAGLHPGMALMRAGVHRQMGDLQAAAKAYQRAAALAPGYGDAWLALGQTWFQLGDHAKAEQALARAIELTGGDSTSYGLYSLVLSRLGKHEAAGHAVRMAKLLKPETRQWDTHAAMTAMKNGRMDEAAAILDEMVWREPDRADLWSLRARVFLGMGDQDRATRNLDVAVALDPQDGDALCDLADLYVARGEFQRAIVAYRKALSLKDPQVAKRVLRGARALAAQDPSSDAKGLMAAVLGSADPSDRDNKLRGGLQLGLTLQKEGRYEESASTLRQALEIDPTNARILLALAQTKRRLGKSEEADALLQRAQNDPGSAAAALAQRASIHLGRGDYTKAEVLARQSLAIKESPSLRRLLEQLEKARKKKN